MDTRSIQGPHLLMVSMPMPKPRHSAPSSTRTVTRLSFGNLCIRDSATTSNIFCKELTPAKIMAIYRMMAKS